MFFDSMYLVFVQEFSSTKMESGKSLYWLQLLVHTFQRDVDAEAALHLLPRLFFRHPNTTYFWRVIKKKYCMILI